jgi:hypothetical protein
LLDKLKNQHELFDHQQLLLRHHLNLLDVEEKFVQEIIDIIKRRPAAQSDAAQSRP